MKQQPTRLLKSSSFTQHPKIIKRKARNKIRSFLGLFLIFCITLVCLVTIFLLQKNQTTLIKPISTLVSTNKTTTAQNPTDEIANLLQKNNIDSQNISVASDSSILVTLKTGEEIIFANNKNPQEEIASLQLIKARLTIEGRRFTRIDFRFDNPVITF